MPIRAGNHITLLENGAQYFLALIAAIDAAEREIHLESYIFEPDATGQRVVEALTRAARRGVRVKLLLDGFGARTFPEALARSLRSAGIALMFYRPEATPYRLRRHRLRRMHRKIAVIDARLAFVGGINIIDDSNAPDHPSHRYDYAVRVEGPLLADIYPAVWRLWWLMRWSRIGHRPRRTCPLPVALTPGGSVAAEFVQRDNLKHRRAIEDAYLAAIRNARAEVLIANAYFLPGRRFRQALVEAAQRGVRVVLVLQGRTDHPLFQLAARALYRYFLERGIEIFEYHASELHAKAAVVDADWATVGSSNIDPFSLLLAREANVVVHDREFARQLRQSLGQAMARGAHAIQRQSWRRVPWYQRLASWGLYGLVRLAMGLLGLASRE
jgi:cardiolipin synthase A/B